MKKKERIKECYINVKRVYGRYLQPSAVAGIIFINSGLLHHFWFGYLGFLSSILSSQVRAYAFMD